MDNQKPMLTINDIARRLRVPVSTCYKLIKTRSLPAFKIGKHIRITEEGLEDWIQSQSPTPRPKM